MQTEKMLIKTGKRIKYLRRKRGWDQKELAKRVGISFSYLCNIEKGKPNPSITVFVSLADVLDVTLDYLVGRRGLNNEDLLAITEPMTRAMLRGITTLDSDNRHLLYMFYKFIKTNQEQADESQRTDNEPR